MEQIIKNQQEQIAGLLGTNRSLVESQWETAGTDGCAATEDTGTAFSDSMAEPSAFRAEI